MSIDTYFEKFEERFSELFKHSIEDYLNESTGIDLFAIVFETRMRFSVFSKGKLLLRLQLIEDLIDANERYLTDNATEEFNTAAEAVAELHNANQRMQDELSKQQPEIDRLKNELAMVKSQRDDHVKELHNVRSYLSRDQKEHNAELKEQNEVLANKLVERNKTVIDRNETIAKHKEHIKALTVEVERAHKVIDEFKEKAKNTKDLTQLVNEQSKQLEEKYISSTKEIVRLTARNNKLRDYLDSKNEMILDLENRISDLITENERLKDKGPEDNCLGYEVGDRYKIDGEIVTIFDYNGDDSVMLCRPNGSIFHHDKQLHQDDFITGRPLIEVGQRWVQWGTDTAYIVENINSPVIISIQNADKSGIKSVTADELHKYYNLFHPKQEEEESIETQLIDLGFEKTGDNTYRRRGLQISYAVIPTPEPETERPPQAGDWYRVSSEGSAKGKEFRLESKDSTYWICNNGWHWSDDFLESDCERFAPEDKCEVTVDQHVAVADVAEGRDTLKQKLERFTKPDEPVVTDGSWWICTTDFKSTRHPLNQIVHVTKDGTDTWKITHGRKRLPGTPSKTVTTKFLTKNFKPTDSPLYEGAWFECVSNNVIGHSKGDIIQIQKTEEDSQWDWCIVRDGVTLNKCCDPHLLCPSYWKPYNGPWRKS